MSIFLIDDTFSTEANQCPSVRSGFDFSFSFVFVCCMSLSFVSSMAAMRLATELPCSRNPSVNVYTVSAKLSANDGIALLGCLLTCIRPSFWRVNRLTAYCEGVVFDEWNMVEKVVWHVYIGQHIKKSSNTFLAAKTLKVGQKLYWSSNKVQNQSSV